MCHWIVSVQEEVKYWKGDVKDLLMEFNASETGLGEAEAARRLKEHGFNEIPHAGHRTTAMLLLSQFKNPLVYILIFAAALAGFLGDRAEATIIVVIMLVNAILGFAQEFRSERAFDELTKYLSYTAVVLREGRKRVIDERELVPGDIVYLKTGDVVSADMRVLEADELQTNESLLTGESTAVEKVSTSIQLDAPLPHQLSNVAFMGSTVVNGEGTCLVVATGKKTYFGSIANSLSTRPPLTDFQKSIARFGSFLVRMVLVITAFIFIVNSVLGHGVLDSLIFSLALTVGIMPEALPVIITVGLSDGAKRLVKKKVIIKRLAAIEDLGNIDVLCTDKTGTLTENEIKIQDIVDPRGQSDPDLIRYALLCNSATVDGDRILGNPIDVAIWKYAKDEGFDEETLKEFRSVHDIPFGYNRRRMSVVVEAGGRRILISKGAPESILEVSTHAGYAAGVKQISQAKDEINSLIEKYGRGGSRMIALAYKEVDDRQHYSVKDEYDLTYVGLLVMSDPPRKDAAIAIDRLKSLAIRLKILSGDDPVVTADVCRQVGIDLRKPVITGFDIENEKSGNLQEVAEENDVFGRVTPDQKLAIVTALRKNGHVAGFLGDGVNDAPALKAADAGISVESGVQVAKEASSVILLEKDLGVIADGVAEGRKVFGNMMKYIMNTMSGNFSNMFTIAVCSLFLPFIPLLPSQVLLINLLTDAPLITISTDRLDEERLRSPKRWNIRLITRFMVFFGLISSVFDFIMIVSLVYLLNTGPEIFRTAWFIESVVHEILITFAIRTRRKFYESRPSNLLISASVIMVAVTLVIVYSPIGLFFEFVRLPLWFLALISGILGTYFFLVETSKHFFFNRYEV